MVSSEVAVTPDPFVSIETFEGMIEVTLNNDCSCFQTLSSLSHCIVHFLLTAFFIERRPEARHPRFTSVSCSPCRELFPDNDRRSIHYPIRIEVLFWLSDLLFISIVHLYLC